MLTHILNHTLDFSWDDSNRVINRALLVRLIAELAKSYSIVATLVAESYDLNGQPFMVSLLSKCIVPSSFFAVDGNLSVAVKTFVAAVASCSHSPKVCFFYLAMIYIMHIENIYSLSFSSIRRNSEKFINLCF